MGSRVSKQLRNRLKIEKHKTGVGEQLRNKLKKDNKIENRKDSM
jgi:hypothetical protein